MTVMAEFSIAPVGLGKTSMHEYVAEAVKIIEGTKGVDWQLTPMGTILEAEEIDPILEIVRKSHEALRGRGVKRISSSLRIDHRIDVKGRRMTRKVRAVKRMLGDE
jgi:uncharacterized protein (TIGR00106 family)